MVEQITIKARVREQTGPSAARRLRRSGRVPAVIYRAGKKARLLDLDAHELENILHHHTGENFVMDVDIGGRPRKALLKEVQHDVVTGRPLHVDFYEVSMKERVHVTVALELSGEPLGVTQQGGVLEQLLHEVEVECLPGDIPESFSVDVSGLKIGQHITVGDLPIDTDKYGLITGADVVLAAVAAPRVQEEVEAAAEEAEAGVTEPEVISEKKGEGSEAEGGEGS